MTDLADTKPDLKDVLRPATLEERACAEGTLFDLGVGDEISVDDDAKVSVIEGSKNIWVQAWVYVKLS